MGSFVNGGIIFEMIKYNIAIIGVIYYVKVFGYSGVYFVIFCYVLIVNIFLVFFKDSGNEEYDLVVKLVENVMIVVLNLILMVNVNIELIFVVLGDYVLMIIDVVGCIVFSYNGMKEVGELLLVFVVFD